MRKLQYDLFYIKHMSTVLDLYVVAPHRETRAPRTWRVIQRPTRPRRVPIVNAMTIDVEDYFHVSAFDGVGAAQPVGRLESRVYSNTERVLAILDEAGVTGTFFVLGLGRRAASARWCDGSPARGHEIASHGYAHRLVYDQSPAAFREDVRRAKHLLEDIAAASVRGFRAPELFHHARGPCGRFDVLIEEGYRYDASVFPIHHDRYGIPVSSRRTYRIERPGGCLVEVPASASRWCGVNLPVGGAGYFRLLPYAWTHWGLKRINTVEKRGAVFYLHPWELDDAQPRLPADALTRVRHYRNLGKTEPRLRRLLKDFAFGPMASVVLDREDPAWSPESLAAALPYLY
jgi:polysaccharide deacetylase family protein (PEP-CTERM system associated)